MSHPNQPEYFTINSVCPHDGQVTCLGIFEDMDAVSYRLKRMYTSCGDEYRVECFHLSTAESEAVAYNEQTVSRAAYRKKEADKEAKLKEYDEWKGQIKEDLQDPMDLGKKLLLEEQAQLPNIKPEYQTLEAS